MNLCWALDEKVLTDALHKKNETLFTYCIDGPKGGKMLMKALCKNITLTSLNIGYTRLGFEIGEELAEGFYNNTSLISLGLKSIKLSSGGKKTLASLCKNITLASLDISSNELELRY